MLNQFAIATLNHLLAQAAWACEKLKPHTGRVALLVSAPVALRLQVDADGRFAEAAADTPADATIELPTAALPQILHGFDAVSRQVSVSGNADFAGRIIFDENGVETFNFGKHKGKPVEQVFREEPSYYSWMMNGDFPLYTKKVLTEIKLRTFGNK